MSAVRRASLTAVAPAQAATASSSASASAILLNDMLQSLLPAIYPMLEEEFSAGLRSDRPHRADQSDDGSVLQPMVGCTSTESPGLSLAVGMGFYARWPGALAMAAGSRRCSCAAAWSASGRPFFTPSRRAWRGWPRAAATVWPSRSFKPAATRASAIGPLAAALIILPLRPRHIAWFTVVALGGDRRSVAHRFVGAQRRATSRRLPSQAGTPSRSPASHVPAFRSRAPRPGVLEVPLSREPRRATTRFSIQKFHVSVQSRSSISSSFWGRGRGGLLRADRLAIRSAASA